MTQCTSCALAPAALAERGTLVVTNLDAAEIGALSAALAPYGVPVRAIEGGMSAITLFKGVFEIVLDWARLLSDAMVEAGHCIVLEDGEALSFAHMGKMRPLSSFVKRLKNAWVADIVRDNRLTAHFQPIVDAQDPARIHAHECLMRGVGTEGESIQPSAILDAADEEGLLFHLDRLCRLNAIRLFAEQGVPGKAFINFNPVSVYNPIAWLPSTVAAARSVGLTPDRIVFELIERNHVADEAHLLRVVDFYRAAGYGVALDDVGAGYSSLNLLSVLCPNYIKVDMNLVRGVDKDPVRQSILGNLLEMARKLDILSIVEGIETVEEYEFVRKLGGDLVQGYLFGRPQPHAIGAIPLAKAA